MKRQILKSALIAVAGVGLMAGSAMATGFSFFGFVDYKNLDANLGLETIDFGSTSIVTTDPAADYLSGKTLILPDFTISNFTTLALSTTFFDNAFIVKDGANIIFTADLTVASLVETGGTASVNPAFAVNLTDVQIDPSYTLGTSPIVDAFYIGTAGSLSATLQLTVQDFSNYLASTNTTFSGTYSGNASPVPEPTTMLLFGSGLLGLAAVARKRS